ncbi:PAS domain-containing sensor histidine kinase [Bacillus tianshenii]|nr:PAS domain-containing sensor histidine kinase [Bacillus tianshenii]
MHSLQLDNRYLKQIFEYIQDGIIVMDQSREIKLMNPSAMRLTGWNVGDFVPYCTFCENRSLKKGENKCYLIAREEVPYFLSKMPTYHGKQIDVEMSTALIYSDQDKEQKEYLLVLRDQTLRQKEEEARISKLMIQKLIQAQEREHKRLAQELHDGVSQSLYTISVALEAIDSFVQNEKLSQYLEEVRLELENVISDVKSYSHHLRPKVLDSLGLIPAVESLITSIKRNAPQLEIRFEAMVEERLHSTVEINLYRFVQEALHNIVKYAEASNVLIEIRKEANQITIKVVDDGKGFEREAVKDGLGLKHMAERIEQLGGTFTLRTAVGKGTILIGQIPFKERGL